MGSKRTSGHKGQDLPCHPLALDALRVLAPSLRLVSAAMWKVVKRRDVLHYGAVEEFVTSSCETVPGLLTFRHQAKLALGLRGRLILELCCGQDPPDAEAILLHLDRIRAPASSSPILKRDDTIEQTVINFRHTVQTLLSDPVEREHYSKELPVEYGPEFDLELEKLLWEFLIRMDSRFPAPSLAQTVSWLSSDPAVLEECTQSPFQFQLLKTLLQHQYCLGHIDPAASLPPHMGDCILDRLPLSGRVMKSNPSSARTPNSSNLTPGTATNLSFTKPVIGLMSNEDVPILASAKRTTECTPVSRTMEDEEDTKDEELLAATRKNTYTQVRRRLKCTDDHTAVEQSGQTPKSEMKRKREQGRESGGGSEEENVAPNECETEECLLRAREAAKEPRVVLTKLHLAGVAPSPTGPADDVVADSEDEATKNFKGRLFVKRYHRTKHGTYIPTLREFWKPRLARRSLLAPGTGQR